MDEVVAMRKTNSPEASYMVLSLLCTKREVIYSAREGHRMNYTILALSGARSTLLAVEQVMFEMESREDGRVDRSDDNMAARELREMLNNNGYSIFVRLLKLYFVECGYDIDIVRHEKICLPKSAYVCCCRTPTLTDKMQNCFVVFEDDARRNIQRAVTAKSLYVSSKGRYSKVLLSGDKDRDKSDSIRSSKENSVWFAKSLAFVRVRSEELENSICKLHKKKSRIECAYNADKELCVVQWFEVFDGKVLKVKKIDRKLRRIRLRWH